MKSNETCINVQFYVYAFLLICMFYIYICRMFEALQANITQKTLCYTEHHVALLQLFNGSSVAYGAQRNNTTLGLSHETIPGSNTSICVCSFSLSLCPRFCRRTDIIVAQHARTFYKYKMRE